MNVLHQDEIWRVPAVLKLHTNPSLEPFVDPSPWSPLSLVKVLLFSFLHLLPNGSQLLQLLANVPVLSTVTGAEPLQWNILVLLSSQHWIPLIMSLTQAPLLTGNHFSTYTSNDHEGTIWTACLLSVIYSVFTLGLWCYIKRVDFGLDDWLAVAATVEPLELCNFCAGCWFHAR